MKLRTVLLCGLASILAAGLAAQAQVPGVNSTLQSVFTLAYDNSTMKQTYSASVTFVPAAAATDVCTINGSATRNVRVRRLLFNMIATTIQSDPFAVIKRSTANAAGTATDPTIVPHDSSNSAATAFVTVYTANPGTLGTSVGLVADPYVTNGNLTTGGPVTGITVFEFAKEQPIVLRGVAQTLSLNFNGLTYPSAQANCTWEWTEE